MVKRQVKVSIAMAGIASIGLTACSSGSEDSGEIELAITDTMSETSAPIYEEIYDQCASELGITVTANHVAGSGLIQTVLQQASSDTLPDVLMLDNPDVQEIAQAGALSPLSEYGIDSEGYPDSVIQAGTYEGDLYGLAPVVNSLALFYNVEVLEEAGIEAPQTWDELSAAAEELTEGDRYGIAFSSTNSFEGTWQFLPFMWSNGGTEEDIAAQETVEALEFVDGLVEDGSASSSVVTWSQNDVNDQFLAGNAAMMVNGPWNRPSLEDSDVEFDSVPLPTPDGEAPVAPLGGEAFTVPNTGDSETMEAAGEFVSCISGDEHQLTMASERGAVPSSTAVAEEAAADDPFIESFVSTVQSAQARTATLGPEWPDAATRIYTAVQLALTDEMDPEDALEQAASE